MDSTSFIAGALFVIVVMQLMRAFYSPPRWYHVWKQKRWERRFWAQMDPKSREWYRQNLPVGCSERRGLDQ